MTQTLTQIGEAVTTAALSTSGTKFIGYGLATGGILLTLFVLTLVVGLFVRGVKNVADGRRMMAKPGESFRTPTSIRT